jgi:hypothetical protein
MWSVKLLQLEWRRVRGVQTFHFFHVTIIQITEMWHSYRSLIYHKKRRHTRLYMT